MQTRSIKIIDLSI